ncbi:hypothetical protein [Nocardia sp. NBC_00511]|uniref:hypothetical protein n=1 Tax=Nocardia sp. NBC_00511 TaxID=2903591 RepID=UPI0030E48F02
MTTVPTTAFRSTHRADTAAIFRRVAALFTAAGRAVPFHRPEMFGSTNFDDRDVPRTAAELNAIMSIRGRA